MNKIAYNEWDRTTSQSSRLPAHHRQAVVEKRAMLSGNGAPDLKKIPLFDGLTEQQYAWLSARLSTRVVPRGYELIEVGMPGEGLYVILSGTVKVSAPQLGGEDVIIAILGPGDPVGEMSLVDRGGRSASVITLEETRLLWMSQYAFQEAIQAIPTLVKNLMQILSIRLRVSGGQIQAMARLDVQQRVVRQLLIFAERYGRSVDHAIEIPIHLTQGDLAGLVGASRKRVNQAIVALKQAGWISVSEEAHFTIHHKEAMETSIS